MFDNKIKKLEKKANILERVINSRKDIIERFDEYDMLTEAQQHVLSVMNKDKLERDNIISYERLLKVKKKIRTLYNLKLAIELA